MPSTWQLSSTKFYWLPTSYEPGDRQGKKDPDLTEHL